MTVATDEPRATDKGHWTVQAQVRKYLEDATPWRDADRMAEFEAEFEPYEVVDMPGNLLMNAGIQRMLDLLIGAGGQALNNTHARLGVGNSSTAAAASQTDLQAAAGSTNRWFQLMDATYPSRASQTLTFQATFGSSDGNFTWNEWCIDAGTANANTVTAPMLNRKVENLGTKTTGTWVLQVTITIS
jgi:hypothetical protein